MTKIDQSRPGLIFLIFLATFVFVGLQVLNYLASDPAKSYGLFNHTVAEVSAMYPLDVTPAGATFAIWGVIYAWQAAILLYSLTSICRQGPEGPVYANPTLLPPSFFIFFILNNFCNAAWLFLWDRLYVTISSVFLFLIAFTLYICLIISYLRLNRFKSTLIRYGRQREVSMIVFIVQNGIAIYATWTTIASLINLGVVIAYKTSPEVGREIASSIALGLLTIKFVVYVGADLTVLNRYGRYVFTPYLVVFVASIGIIVKNWNPQNPNSIFTVTVLALSVLSIIVKLMRMTGSGRGLKKKYETMLQHNYKTLY